MFSAYLLLGSNQGDRLYYLKQAEIQIEQRIGVIKKKSLVYESEAWGFKSNITFLNRALLIETGLTPEDILGNIHEIELILGRIRNTNYYTDRNIDIDILFIDNLIIETSHLIIPHPHIQKRKFALTPLFEIDKNFKHPVNNKTIQILMEECEDRASVNQYKGVFNKNNVSRKDAKNVKTE